MFISESLGVHESSQKRHLFSPSRDISCHFLKFQVLSKKSRFSPRFWHLIINILRKHFRNRVRARVDVRDMWTWLLSSIFSLCLLMKLTLHLITAWAVRSSSNLFGRKKCEVLVSIWLLSVLIALVVAGIGRIGTLFIAMAYEIKRVREETISGEASGLS